MPRSSSRSNQHILFCPFQWAVWWCWFAANMSLKKKERKSTSFWTCLSSLGKTAFYVTACQGVSIAAFPILEVLWESSLVPFTCLSFITIQNEYKLLTSHSLALSLLSCYRAAVSVTTHPDLSPTAQNIHLASSFSCTHFLPASLAFPFQPPFVAPPSLSVL